MTLRLLGIAYARRDVRIRGHVPRTWVLIDTTGRRISMGRTNVVRGRR